MRCNSQTGKKDEQKRCCYTRNEKCVCQWDRRKKRRTVHREERNKSERCKHRGHLCVLQRMTMLLSEQGYDAQDAAMQKSECCVMTVNTEGEEKKPLGREVQPHCKKRQGKWRWKGRQGRSGRSAMQAKKVGR